MVDVSLENRLDRQIILHIYRSDQIYNNQNRLSSKSKDIYSEGIDVTKTKYMQRYQVGASFN